MVMIDLTEQDLTDITIALVTMYMRVDLHKSDPSYQKRCGNLHDKIQITRIRLEK